MPRTRFQKFEAYLGRLIRKFIVNLNLTLAIFVSIFVIIGGFFYNYAGQITKKSLAEQTLHREQVISRAGARSMESFLDLVARGFATLALQDGVSLNDNEMDITSSKMQTFIDEWEGTPFVEVVLSNTEGELLMLANRGQDSFKKGIDISDRDYFNEAKKLDKGDVYVGSPILPRTGDFEGQYILPISTPVYSDSGELEGVLGGAILLSGVTEKYLKPLRISEDTNIYLIDSSGTFLYSSNYPEIISDNIFSYLENDPFPGRDYLVNLLHQKFDEVFSKKEGKIDFVRNDYYKKTKLGRFLLAYSVVDLDNTDVSFGNHMRWVLAVETPAQDAFIFFWPFARRQTIVLIVFMIFIVFNVLFTILLIRIAQKEAYLKGFSLGRYSKKAEKRKN